MVDNISYVQGFVQNLVIISCLHVSAASLSKKCGGGGVSGCIDLITSWYIVLLGLAWAKRDMGAVVQYACLIVLPLFSGL